MRVCHKSHPIRPERAKAPSPGHRPGFKTNTKSRPERAKAFNIKAFALSGRLCFLSTLPRAMPWARSFWAFSPTLLPLWTYDTPSYTMFLLLNKPNYYLNKPNSSASMRSVTLRKSSGLSANSKVSPSMMMSRPL